MTHLHIPDGILPVGIWLTGLLVMAIVMTFCLSRVKGSNGVKRLPLLGAVSAIMLIAMSLEIFPLAYHVNLSVVAGILLGPSIGFLAAFITNLMLALLGHGGITVIGLNTLLLGVEAGLGHLFFSRLPSRMPVFWRGAAASILTLLLTTLMLIGLVAAARLDPDLLHHAGHDEGIHRPIEAHQEQSIQRFAIVTLSLGAIGWILEAAVTGAVASFLSRVRPDLLNHALHCDTCSCGKGQSG